jgi:hypothetical protein
MSLLSNIFGSSTSHLNPGPAALANNPHSAASLSMAQLSNHAQQQFNNAYAQGGGAYNAYAQQAMNQSYAAQQHQWIQGLGQTNSTKRYMIDGKTMDFEEFVDTIYPDDCAEKTHLILKFKKED